MAQEIGGTAGFKADDRGEVGLELLRAGTVSIAENLGAPLPVDSCPIFESGEIIIDRVFKICVHGVVVSKSYFIDTRFESFPEFLDIEPQDGLKLGF